MNINTHQRKRLKNFITQTEKYNLELTEQEKLKMFNHYQKGELNQFALMIILKILAYIKYPYDKHRFILSYMVKISAFDFSGISMNTVEDIVQFATTAYKHSMIVILSEEYADRF